MGIVKVVRIIDADKYVCPMKIGHCVGATCMAWVMSEATLHNGSKELRPKEGLCGMVNRHGS